LFIPCGDCQLLLHIKYTLSHRVVYSVVAGLPSCVFTEILMWTG